MIWLCVMFGIGATLAVASGIKAIYLLHKYNDDVSILPLLGIFLVGVAIAAVAGLPILSYS